MSFDADHLQQQIPHYLTAEDRQILIQQLEAIAAGGAAGYVLSNYDETFDNGMLQGDGWRGFRTYNFQNGALRSVRGIILSNSCDIAPENPRDVPPRVTFAPLVKLEAYRSVLIDSDIAEGVVENKIEAIKSQKTTNIFYIPAGGMIEEDYIVRLDEAQSMPISILNQSEEREKLFTLSMTGFYMLVFKLSVHFCRLQESINRGYAAAQV